MRIKIAIFALLVLTILINMFIFANSFDDVERSYEKSDVVTDVIESIVKDDAKEINLSYLVRKSAHLFEFAMLGIVLTSVCI